MSYPFAGVNPKDAALNVLLSSNITYSDAEANVPDVDNVENKQTVANAIVSSKMIIDEPIVGQKRKRASKKTKAKQLTETLITSSGGDADDVSHGDYADYLATVDDNKNNHNTGSTFFIETDSKEELVSDNNGSVTDDDSDRGEHNRRIITRDKVPDMTEDFFTRPDTIQQCAEMAQKYVTKFPSLLYVDFSAGKNEFAVTLCEMIPTVSYKSFDIKLYKGRKGEVNKKDWLEVERKDLISSSDNRPIVIGLNPPFGRKSSVLDKFMKKACSFEPKLLFLICPYRYNLPKECAPWYDVLEKIDLPPSVFYRSSIGLDASEYDVANQFHQCKFVILGRREKPQVVPKALTKHPLVNIYGLSTLDDPNNIKDAENVIIVRKNGHLSGHSYFFPLQGGSFDEYRLNEFKGSWKSWTSCGYATSTYTCLHFKAPHPSREIIRQKLIEEYKVKQPLSFVPNQCCFSINKAEFCEMLNNILKY